MGKIQDTLFVVESTAGTAARAANVITDTVLTGPNLNVLQREVPQLVAQGMQIYNLTRAGAVGITDPNTNPAAYTPPALTATALSAASSAYGLYLLPGQIRAIKASQYNRGRKALMYVSAVLGGVANALDIAEASFRGLRLAGVDV